MNEQDVILLDDYFNGLLLADEARRVEARAASEAVFGEAFSLRQQMEAFPRREARRLAFVATLQNVGAEYFQDEKTATPPSMSIARSNVRRWMALAASLALIAAAIWFFKQPSEQPALATPTYDHYAQHAPLSLTVMGNTEQAKTEAESAFKQKDYARALAALNQVLATEPANIKATFYRGICQLELRRPSVARAVFIPLATGNSALREDAAWYVALTYLQENNLAACRAALEKIAAGEAHYEQAQEILKGLQ